MKNDWRVLGAVCALVIGIYVYVAQSGPLERQSPDAADTYYNLLVRGFRGGRLSLEKDVPPAFTRLADPYDPTANARFRLGSDSLHDLSYYKGKLYLYWGITPALILFWPFVALTGEYLFHKQAVVIFCAVGFLASVGLLRAIWRRYFAGVNVGVMAAGALALGLASGVPLLLPRSAYNEVAISCGYMLTMLALGAIWCALHQPARRWQWLAVASVAYGLAVGARPSLLFGAPMLLAPVAQGCQERQKIRALLLAATGPITLIGLGLMLYNDLRFDNPFEFGTHYQLAEIRSVTRQYFSRHYLWFNFRVYFLEPARWSARFPFVREIARPPLPAGYGRTESPFGVLTNIPLVWLSLAVPLAWRGRSDQAAWVLRWFVMAVVLFVGICALPLLFFESAIIRYEVDFLPALLLLAVVGILGLERARAGQPVWRHVVRWGWSLLLVFSVAFNLLASVGYYAFVYNDLGNSALLNGGVQEAIGLYGRALRLNPDYAEAHYNLGNALAQAGRVPEAIAHYQQALRTNPDYVEAHVNLGNALLRAGNAQEAAGQYQQALRVNPDYAEAHSNLGAIYQRMGKLPEAVVQYEQALRSKPDYVEAHLNLGLALEKLGRTTEAIEHYQQALKLRPDFIPARNALARLRNGQ